MAFLRKRLHNHLAAAAFLCAITYLLLRHFAPSSFTPLALIRDLATPRPQYAYATFLSPYAPSSSSPSDSPTSIPDSQDPYFTSLRLLTYQLLHDPRTRTRLHPPIPLLILALPTVPSSQTTLLASHGANIILIQPLDLPASFNATASSISRSRFRDVLAKLRLWQLTQYDKVLALDADTILISPLDNIFTDPEFSTPSRTRPANTSTSSTHDLDPPLPSTYLLAASADTWGAQIDWVGSALPSYLCACFMLLTPSATLFTYYEAVLNRPEAAFTAAYPDQDLLIYAHRREGRMPWRLLPLTWSANDGGMLEEVPELKSLHVKAWDGAEGGNLGGKKVALIRKKLVGKMEDFYRKREQGVAVVK